MPEQMPVIVFRCDASPHIGTGHVMRCLTLAQKFKEKLFRVSFLSTQETLETVRALRESGFPVHPENKTGHADWLIVDHYGLDASYESTARRWAKNIMVIDDLADRPHDCDLLMDQTYGRNASDYKDLVPETCKILAGVKYALLRKEFSQLRQTLDRDFSKAQRVLISFGGTNPKGATEYALSMIRGYKEKSLTLDVVTGASAATLPSVEEAVAAIENDGFHKIALHLDTPHIADLMVQADLCIGAAGATSWERCCLKLPTIALELADNQKLVLENLGKAGAVYNMGAIAPLKEPDFLEVFSKYIASEPLRKNMAEKAGALCPGDGADRVFCQFLKETAKSGHAVSLRFAEEEDCRTIFEWQTNPEIRKYARTPQAPSWEEHQAWLANSLNNPDRQIFVVEYDGKAAGVVRLDKEDVKQWQDLSEDLTADLYEISILIDPVLQGQGIAAAALSLLRAYEPNATLIAEVLPDNKASHALFCHAGFTPANTSWYISTPHAIEKGTCHAQL